MPTATDLVTDLPADFEVFGQAVATSMADLLGGTSGQILAKNSNTDMDFVWIANDQGDITAVTAGTGISGGGTSGAVTITNSMATEITAKADLIVGTGNAAFDNLPVGANGTVLTADSTVSPTGLKWATPAGPTFVGVSALRNGVNTAMTANTAFAVAYTTEQYDTNTFHDNSTNNTRITIPSGYGGKYQLSAFIGNPYGTPGGYMIMYVYKNGSIFTDSTFFGGQAVRMNTGVYNTLALSTTITTVATDYWEIYYQQGATETQLFYSNFQLSYLGA